MFKLQSSLSGVSLVLTILALVLSIFIIAPIFGTINASETINRPPIILIYVIYLFLIAGMILSMMSFKRKERPVLLRWTAFILNLILLIAIVALLIFAMSMSR